MATGGRWSLVSTRPIIEHGLSIDVHGLVKSSSRSSMLRWTRDGELFALARYSAATWDSGDGVLALVFEFDRRPAVQRITLVSSPCRYGGRRWYAICPATGRRVAKLYTCDGERFLSRQAYRAAYASQNEDHIDRVHRRRRKVAGRLGSDDLDTPPKPKWMRWRTYDRLNEKMTYFDNQWAGGVLQMFGRLTR